MRLVLLESHEDRAVELVWVGVVLTFRFDDLSVVFYTCCFYVNFGIEEVRFCRERHG